MLLRQTPLLDDAGYQIEHSLIFDSADSSGLYRSLSVAGSTTTFTLHGHVKRNKLGTRQILFSASNAAGNDDFFVDFTSADKIRVHMNDGSGGLDCDLLTTAVFRDVAQFYAINIIVDTSNSTAGDRVRLEVNGTLVDAFDTEIYPAQSYAVEWNAGTYNQQIGDWAGSSFNADYILSEVRHIDGQALDSTNFGEFDQYGVWQPKKYIGTYGTNGFHLDFADDTDMGKDVSGNGNHFTGVAVNSQSPSHRVLDTPTNNYCTLSVLEVSEDDPGSPELTDGNLYIHYAATNSGANGTIWAASGKYVCEMEIVGPDNNIHIGAIDQANKTARYKGLAYQTSNGQIRVDSVVVTTSTAASAGDIVRCELDLDTGNIEWFVNDASVHSRSFTPGGKLWTFSAWMVNDPTTEGGKFNFGQRPFVDTPTAGFKALCSNNLPEPDIRDPGKYFKAVTYNGNSGTNNVTGVGFQSDLVWIKNRDSTPSHVLFDAMRGVSARLFSNGSYAETPADGTGVDSFDSDGFTINDSSNAWNNSAYAYVAWCWKKGAIPGLDIVTYTGNGATTQNVSHSLGVKPELFFTKNLSIVKDWRVYVESEGAGKFLYLNLSNSLSTSLDVFNNTEPTATMFSVGNDEGSNGNGHDMVAYLFASIPGFSKVFSYTGNNSDDGPFIPMDFQPAYVMIKRIDVAGEWIVKDTTRKSDNTNGYTLFPNDSASESSPSHNPIDILSNGFKARSSSTDTNALNGEYIGIAFAEHPFKYSRAR